MHLSIVALFLLTLFISPAAAAADRKLLPPLIDLGQDVHRGVKAQAQLEPQPLLDSREPLGGDLHHYLISVVFTELDTGKVLLEGQVAARVYIAGQRTTKTVRLEPQPLRWSGILGLPAKGETLIKIGSKLADGKKRIYRFFYNRRL